MTMLAGIDVSSLGEVDDTYAARYKDYYVSPSQEAWAAFDNVLTTARQEFDTIPPHDGSSLGLPVAYIWGGSTLWVSENVYEDWLLDDYWADDADRIAEGYWRE